MITRIWAITRIAPTHISMTNKRAVVAMSGGVDSSVAAALLKEQGYNVIGISMRLIGYAEGTERVGGCCSIDDLNDARRVCDQLEIPFYVINLENAFREKVIERFISEYLSGRTPNPCVLCNQRLKFEILLNKARELEAEYLATGHYARILFDDGLQRYQLLKGIDPGKDQSYFLFTLTQEQLNSVLFPLGGIKKEEVRRLAQKFNLRVAEKVESQEICFIPDDNYSKFILEKASPYAIKPGDIVDSSGKVLGRHSGIHNYTIGQRKGLGISSPRPLYVIGFDLDKNHVIVGEEAGLYSNALMADEVNWLSISKPEGEMEATVKIRYRHDGEDAVIKPLENDKVQIEFKSPVKSITPGQAAVFYDGDIVLGGGWIKGQL